MQDGDRTRGFDARRNDWESNFFQREIWALIPSASAGLSISDHLKASPNVNLWECRVPISETATIETLISFGFFLSDTACEFAFDLSNGKLDSEREEATGIERYIASPADIPKLEGLIQEDGFETRFERRPFSPGEGARFYGMWVRSAVLGTFDDVCAILERKGEILGFVTLRDVAPREARIGLIYTALGARGSGIGDLLFSYAVELSRQREINVLRMATQLTNRGAIALSSRMKGRPIRIGAHMYLPTGA